MQILMSFFFSLSLSFPVWFSACRENGMDDCQESRRNLQTLRSKNCEADDEEEEENNSKTLVLLSLRLFPA